MSRLLRPGARPDGPDGSRPAHGFKRSDADRIRCRVVRSFRPGQDLPERRSGTAHRVTEPGWNFRGLGPSASLAPLIFGCRDHCALRVNHFLPAYSRYPPPSSTIFMGTVYASLYYSLALILRHSFESYN